MSKQSKGAARPPEPSAPQIEPNILERVKKAFPEFAAPQTSAEPCPICGSTKSPHAVGLSCHIPTPIREINEFPAAPQPVSGDAPEWTGVNDGSKQYEFPRDLAVTVAGDAPKVEEIARLAKSFVTRWVAERYVQKYPGHVLCEIDILAATELAKDFAVELLRRYFPPASQTPKSVIEAATELLDAMETCHICHSYLILQEFPVHCEDCSSDCENHDGGECTPIYDLHAKLRKLLKLATPASTARTDRDLRQIEVAEWCSAAFGADQCSVPMRGLRMLEEAIEAYQSATIGLPTEEMTAKAHALVDYVMNRLAGNLAQECGGVGLTLLALCQAAGISAAAEELREIARVKSKPLAHFHQRNQVKNEAGFELAAPGSVPQAPKDECLYGPVGKHIFNPHDDEPRRCVNCGVPQAEPPKEGE